MSLYSFKRKLKYSTFSKHVLLCRIFIAIKISHCSGKLPTILFCPTFWLMVINWKVCFVKVNGCFFMLSLSHLCRNHPGLDEISENWPQKTPFCTHKNILVLLHLLVTGSWHLAIIEFTMLNSSPNIATTFTQKGPKNSYEVIKTTESG